MRSSEAFFQENKAGENFPFSLTGILILWSRENLKMAERSKKVGVRCFSLSRFPEVVLQLEVLKKNSSLTGTKFQADKFFPKRF